MTKIKMVGTFVRSPVLMSSVLFLLSEPACFYSVGLNPGP